MVNKVKVKLTKRENSKGIGKIADHVPLGKLYTVDLDNVTTLHFEHKETGVRSEIECIWAEDEGGFEGYLPVEIFDMAEQETGA